MPVPTPFDPQTMLAAIERIPRPATFMRDMLLSPNPQLFATEFVQIDLRKGRRRMAPFVGRNKGGKMMEREGFKNQNYTPPLIVPRDVITAERLQQRQAGETAFSGRSPAERLAQEEASIMNAFDLAISRREEWMLNQLIWTGAIHMVGDGYDETYDVSFTQSETLGGGDLWTADTADPIEYLRERQELVTKSSGITPNIAVMEPTVGQAFRNNPIAKAQLSPLQVQIGRIDPRVLPNGASYLGRIDLLNLDVYTYQEWFADDITGALSQMVPTGGVAVLPTYDRNVGAEMLYGSWTEISDMKTYMGTRIPRQWVDKPSNTMTTEYVARPLPTMVDSDCWTVSIVK